MKAIDLVNFEKNNFFQMVPFFLAHPVARGPDMLEQFGPVWEGNSPRNANYIDSGGVQSRKVQTVLRYSRDQTIRDYPRRFGQERGGRQKRRWTERMRH